jgi:hypothetical protein
MTQEIHVNFASKVKLFRSESYEVETKDLIGIETHVFIGKKDIGKFEINFGNIVQGSLHFDKTELDKDYYFSYADFEFNGIIHQKIPLELLSLIKNDTDKKIKYKALRIIAINKNSTSKQNLQHALLLNEDGDWAKINIKIA